MQVRIHRGAHQIGGSCVEVESGDARLVLDVGRPLDAPRDDVIPLPDVAGLASDDASLVGVIITHAHQDHWGLAGQVPAGVPVFMGEATSRILAEAAYWTQGLTVPVAGFLSHRRTFTLGPFTVTPFLNDHSAFDAYSVLVESDGRRLFYTGDICGHGRKHAIFAELLRKPPQDVNVLLMEGTNVRPESGDALDQTSETDLERAIFDVIGETKGLALVTWSAQNIDRLVTVYRAALRSSRDLVVDLYTASIARATGNPNIPQPSPDWPRVRTYVPLWQRVKVKDSGEFSRVDTVKASRVYEEELASDPSRYVVQFGIGCGAAFERAGCLDGASAIWALWPGYLKDDSGRRLVAFYDRVGISWSIQHTSGHASVRELKRLAEAMAPARVVPIHSLGGDRFSSYFNNVERQPDGAWWEV